MLYNIACTDQQVSMSLLLIFGIKTDSTQNNKSSKGGENLNNETQPGQAFECFD